MKFVLRKDRVLVLRARARIVFQASNLEAARIHYVGHGAKLGHEFPGIKEFGGAPAVIFPQELAKKAENPFAAEGKLPSRVAPRSQPKAREDAPDAQNP